MPAQHRPNILLITTDQQRFDTLRCNGNSWIKTPHLDALAGRGINFQRAYIQNTVCIPSRACLQTGRYDHQHGVEYMEEIIDDTPGLPAWEVTFMERLQTAGYHTAGFGKLHMMPHKGFHEMKVCGGKGSRWIKSAGLEIGLGPLGRDYAAWLEARHPGAYEMIYEQRRRPEYKDFRSAIVNVLPLEEYVDYWTAQNTIDCIERPHDKPFFIWCGFCGPHDPMDPPQPYASLYPYDQMPLPPNYGYNLKGEKQPTTAQQDAIARRFCSHYHAQVTLIDDQVGRIVAALKASGQLDDTLIIYTSDHGELMFEFGRTGKCYFFDSVTRVPFIAVPPGGCAQGRAAQDLIETFDLAPTILDYAHAEIPRGMAATTLRPAFDGKACGKESVLCEFRGFSHDGWVGVCLRTAHAKYVQWTDPARGEEFYDLESDPLERKNRINDPACHAEIDRHRRLLIARYVLTGARQ